MGFYSLTPDERSALVKTCYFEILADFKAETRNQILHYFSDEDTYIRKNAYINTGLLYLREPPLRTPILYCLKELLSHESELVRQTVVNSAGEIGKKDFNIVEPFFDAALFDAHHKVRNAVIGSVKKMSEVNPEPVLHWAKKFLHHSDKEIRREICHGIELRGRTHPQDILPLLKELQFDNTSRVYKTLVHVIGQIAYKKGCLETVITTLCTWENRRLVTEAMDEIIDVHKRYARFSHYSVQEACTIIEVITRQKGFHA